ncbi:MAG: hypothetical protein CMJ85_05055 [Planctomycetes bacterium]|jgi:hypothetical protein|nr:hypothetical protein [Planctomycetota bacterium]
MIRFLPLLALLTVASLPAQQRLGLKVGKWPRHNRPRGWLVYQTKHYQIQSQAGKEKAKRLALHMEAMLKVYKKTFRPPKQYNVVNAVKLFKDRKSFLAYSPTGPGAAGYYSKTEKELVFYDTNHWGDEPNQAVTGGPGGTPGRPPRQMDVLGVAAHEGWHQYFGWYVVSWIQIPSWVNEGMGDYYYSAAPKSVRQKRGKKTPLKVGRMNAARLPVIRWAVTKGKHVPFKQIMRYEQRQYYSNPSVCYAQGWSMCHFFLHHKDKKVRALIPRYIARFRQRKQWQKNHKAIFGRVDLDTLEKEWKQWVLQQRMPGTPAPDKKPIEQPNGKKGSAKKLPQQKQPERRPATRD